MVQKGGIGLLITTSIIMCFFSDLVTPIIHLIPLTCHDVTTMTHHEENSGSLLQNILAGYVSDATEGGRKVKPITFIVTDHFLQHSDKIQRET